MKSSRPVPHRELITVLFLTMGSLALYGLADRPLALFGMEIRQAPVREFWGNQQSDLITRQQQEVPAAADSIPVVSVAQINRQPKTQPDTSRQIILLTGDSMAEGLMFALKKYARHNGHTLKTVIWYGSSTKTWAATDTLQKLMARVKPSLVFLSLGSNELFIRNIGDREPYIREIVRQGSQTKFIWIGPPNWKKDTGIHELLLKNVGEDRYFVSKDLIFQRSTDGRHPTRESSARWADTLSGWVMQASRYPIRLEKPTDLTAEIE